MKLIRPRLQVSCTTGTALAVVFAALVTGLFWYSLWSPDFRVPPAGQQTVITYRIPSLGIYRDFQEHPSRHVQPLQVDAGTRLDAETAELLAAVESIRRPPGLAYMLGIGVLLLFFFVFQVHGIRLLSREGRLLRLQFIVLATTTFVVAGAYAFLLASPLSVFWLPLPAFAYALARTVDRPTGLFWGLGTVLTLAVVNAFDGNLAAVLGAECAVLALGAPSHKSSTARITGVWLLAALTGIVVYGAHRFAVVGMLLPLDTETLTRSTLLAVPTGLALSALLSPFLIGGYARLLGRIPRSKLQKLADFSTPLLKQVAKRSPGTWQHTLSVANMAEQVANAIGCDAMLTRVGALYHDIGKSKQPEYFAENLREQRSPHDELSPELSADAIISHVTDGVKMARERGLPERIIDFIHMHHGDQILEYFWDKNRKAGNPHNLAKNDFRYPGLRPQTKESGILAVVDSVEAASRSLKTPDNSDLQGLVRQIILTKITGKQLDRSGLSIEDLAQMASVLVQMLQSQFHVRPEYPWQHKKTAEKAMKNTNETETGPADETADTTAIETTAIGETDESEPIVPLIAAKKKEPLPSNPEKADAQRPKAPREEPKP